MQFLCEAVELKVSRYSCCSPPWGGTILNFILFPFSIFTIFSHFTVNGSWTAFQKLNNGQCVQVDNGSNVWAIISARNCSEPEPKYGGKSCAPDDNRYTDVKQEVCPPGKRTISSSNSHRKPPTILMH